MKRTFHFIVLTISIVLLFSSIVKSQTFLYEDFEDGEKPAGWSYEYVSDIIQWQYLDGGFSNTGDPGTGHPQYAKEGFYNAMFHKESFAGQKTKLVTPELNLEFGIKPELSFWHAQDERYTFEQWNNDELRVYYKQHEDSSWVKIAEYTEKVNLWTERIIQLPDSTLSGTYYIAFEGKSNNGYGVCIDSVAIVEKGIIPRYIEKVDIIQASTDFIATESDNNPILQIDFTVKGNDGQIKLDSLTVKSLNTDDSDIETNGIKLFASDDNLFSNSTLIATASAFVDGKVNFDNINRDLPTGLSSVWITYDIVSDVGHEKHEHILDAMIEEESIKINNSYYPIIDKSPDGERILFESILYDDFETDKGWIYTGEFERAIPLGLGGISKGSPDPDYAVSGNYIIGTDLTDNGDYELNLTDREYTATSPYINCKYYKDTYIYYQRWFNMDSYDQATLDINTDHADNWQTYWQSSGTSINNTWSNIRFGLDSVISRKDSVSIRYTLGPTNDFWNFSGWNIDNAVIVGNYIGRDVAITEWIGPFGGCGLTDEEYVIVKIKNLAGEPMNEPLPISYSFDEGETIYWDTITTTIPVDDSLIYQIDKPIDLSNPGWYENVYAKTHLPGDEETSNDTYTLDIFVSPTYTLPHTQDFESNYGYYLTGGTNSSWEYGTPSGVLINDAASGNYAWVTDLDSDYEEDEDSYIESPCFNLAVNDYPIFEFKSKGIGIDTVAGISVHYTVDGGDTWSIIPKTGDYYWNWYSDYTIRALGTEGIDSTMGEWVTYKQLLPPEVRNQGDVKFRFIFANDSSSTKEGFGIDDIKVYEAPADVGVTAISSPYDACEWDDSTELKVYVKNFGLDTLETGKKIPVIAKFKRTTTITRNDTLTLAADLDPGDSVLFTFNSTFDMSYAGNYRFETYTNLESDPFFYDTISNNTIIDTISVYGMPRYDAFYDVIGDNPVDTVLDAGAGYASYLWQDASINQTFNALAEGLYSVTVTNDSGCVAVDTTQIFSSLIDFKMDSVLAEFEDSCERNTLSEITVRFINDGFEDFEIGDSVLFAYQINDEEIVHDTLWLTYDLPSTPPPTDTAFFTFGQKCDFTEPGEYTLKVFMNFGKDINHDNDTISFNFNTWGYVSTELNYDTIYSSQTDTLELIASPGIYTNYSWNSGDSNDTIAPSNQTFYYKVTVTDANICGTAYDSTFIETYDFGITRINGFNNDCDYNFTVDSTLNVTIKNYSGNDYVSGDTIRVLYKFDDEDWVVNTLTLTGDFNGNTTQNFDIGLIDPTEPGDHSLKVYTSASMDANHSNDTIIKNFETWPFPDVSLAYDTIYTSRPDTITLDATPGYSSYLWTFGNTTPSIDITRTYSEKYVVEVQDAKGCGTDKDSTQIFTYNIGISDIIFPKNACSHKTNENVIITVSNYSNDTIRAGENLDLSYKINENAPITETFLVQTDIMPNKTSNFTFAQKADLSAIDTFFIWAYTQHEFDVKRANDTLYDAIQTYGYPTIELGADIYTGQADTVQLIAEPGYVKYEWNNGVENDTLNVTYPASFEYKLVATNINGCSATDSINIYTYDIAVSSINTPATTCEFNSTEALNVSVLNSSSDTLLSGEDITLSYSLNGGGFTSEIFTLSSNLLPDSVTDFTFTSTLDLTTSTTHNIVVSALMDINVDTSNDTIEVDIEAVGYPSFSLGSDIYTTTPVGTVITAPAGYDSYLWQDGSTNSSFTVSYQASATYSVTVADVYGCSTPDTVELYTYNVAADTLTTPFDQCVLSNAEVVSFTIINNSKDTLLSGETIDVGFILNSGSIVNESFNLTEMLYPDSITSYTFTQTSDLSVNQLHDIKLFAKLSNIDVETDDTVTTTVDYLTPIYDLGDPVVSGDASYTIDAGTGYASYLWFDSSTDQTYVVDINSQKPNRFYAVTVTTAEGCNANDSIQVTFTTTADLEITSLISPVSACWVDAQNYPVQIEITNSGVVNLTPGTNFIVGYIIDGGAEVTENFNLSTAMDANDTRQHTFVSQISFATAKDYEFRPFVTLSDDGNRNNDTLTTVLDISAPEVSLGVSDTIFFDESYEISTLESYNSYLWSTQETTSTITVTETGHYSVTVTDGLGCQGEGTIYCERNTGLDNIINGNGYMLTYYPNPVSEKLMIQFDNKQALDVEIEILSTNGQVVYSDKLKDIVNDIERIDVNPFANGVYYLRLNINDEFYIRKIIIQ